ncbi:hypothetical protein EYV94_21435 [Puteibacter caeruleilacunae]|nr:hypothetical protein EYV94_21435 [Puteibacter caeruleilacunae]
MMSKHLYLTILSFAFIVNSYAQTTPVNGNLEVSGSITTSNQIKLGQSIRVTNRAELHLHSSGENSVSEIFFGSDNRVDDNVRWVLSDRGKSPGMFQLYEGPALSGNFIPRMTFLKGGNIGIGTSNPAAKLEIESSGADYNGAPTLAVRDLTSRGTMFLESVTDNATDFVFKNNGAGRVWLSSRSSYNGYEFNIYTNPDGGSAPEVMAMTIKQNGNIGIGTGNPGTHKLAVDGTIGAREIKVEAGAWSDFVFNKDYKLKGLEEVDNFIRQNNHLPDIPSEKEVLENGIQLGEMDAKLLQKIEELTLYMIEMNKEMKSLKRTNSELKREIEKMKSEQSNSL